MKTLPALLLLTFLLGACATGPAVDPARYQFDQLEEVSSIVNFRMIGWESIDEASLFVQTSPNRYYLLVLQSPLTDIKWAQTLLISSSNGRVQARFDTVSTRDEAFQKVPIEHIYRIDKDQRDEIRKKITGAPDQKT